MCNNPELNLNTFISTNESVIDYLLDITDEVEEKLTTDKYRWVKGINDKAHGGFVRKMDVKGKEGFKAFIVPKIKKIGLIKLEGLDPGVENASEMDSETRIVGNDTNLTFYKNGDNMGSFDMCPFSQDEIDADMLDIPEDLDVDIDEQLMTPPKENDNVEEIKDSIVNELNKLNEGISPEKSNTQQKGGAQIVMTALMSKDKLIKDILELINLIVSYIAIETTYDYGEPQKNALLKSESKKMGDGVVGGALESLAQSFGPSMAQSLGASMAQPDAQSDAQSNINLSKARQKAIDRLGTARASAANLGNMSPLEADMNALKERGRAKFKNNLGDINSDNENYQTSGKLKKTVSRIAFLKNVSSNLNIDNNKEGLEQLKDRIFPIFEKFGKSVKFTGFGGGSGQKGGNKKQSLVDGFSEGFTEQIDAVKYLFSGGGKDFINKLLDDKEKEAKGDEKQKIQILKTGLNNYGGDFINKLIEGNVILKGGGNTSINETINNEFGLTQSLTLKKTKKHRKKSNKRHRKVSKRGGYKKQRSAKKQRKARKKRSKLSR